MRATVGEKGGVPVRYWILWGAIHLAAVLVFYVLLTPLWIGLRLAAWAADLRGRRARADRETPAVERLRP